MKDLKEKIQKMLNNRVGYIDCFAGDEDYELIMHVFKEHLKTLE